MSAKPPPGSQADPPQTDPDPDDVDERLDEALEETFPASDPIAAHPPRKGDPENDD